MDGPGRPTARRPLWGRFASLPLATRLPPTVFIALSSVCQIQFTACAKVQWLGSGQCPFLPFPTVPGRLWGVGGLTRLPRLRPRQCVRHNVPRVWMTL